MGAEFDVIETCSQGLNKELFRSGPSSQKLLDTLWAQDGTRSFVNMSDKYVDDSSRLFALLQTLSGECLSTSVVLKWRRMQDELSYRERCLADGLAWVFRVLGHAFGMDKDAATLAEKGVWHDYVRAAQNVSRGRKFAMTKTKYFALCPQVVEAGDVICLLFGGSTPYCLRPSADGFLFVGECYVHGLMHGEGLAMLERGDLKPQSFNLH